MRKRKEICRFSKLFTMWTKNIVLLAGYVILVFLTILLFLFTLFVKINQRLYLLVFLQILIITGLVYECYKEGLKTLDWEKLAGVRFNISDLYSFIAVLAGTIATYFLSVDLKLGPVVAAGLVGIIVAVVRPSYGVPAYCGAFAGMSCPYYLCAYPQLILAGVIAGIIFLISKPFFIGFGGKLGTIAFAGCLLAGITMKSSLQSLPVPWDIGWFIFFYSALGALFTYLISISLGYGAVFASGLVGITGGLLLPNIHPEAGNVLAVVVICASFVGMSSAERFPKMWFMIIAGIFAGIVFMFSLPYLSGPGGKLGTIAFGSVIALKGIINMFSWLCKQLEKENRQRNET